jgi:hypothetical protein
MSPRSARYGELPIIRRIGTSVKCGVASIRSQFSRTFARGELYIVTRGYWLTVPLIGGHLPTGRREVVPAGFGQQLTLGVLS